MKGGWKGGNWNVVLVGNTNSPANHCSRTDGNPVTTVSHTPQILEKPYLVQSNQGFSLIVPSVEYNKFVGAENSDEDEDASKIVDRRISMNKFNEVGMNFQKYHDSKPSQGVRREILNMFNEYKELEQKEHSKEELISICAQYELERYQFIGYFMNNALASTPKDFTNYIDLVFDYFFKE